MSMELIAKIPLQSSSSFGNACKSVKSAVPGIVAAPQRLHSVEGGNFVGTPKLRSEKAERKRLLSVNAVAVSDRATGRRNVEGMWIRVLCPSRNMQILNLPVFPSLLFFRSRWRRSLVAAHRRSNWKAECRVHRYFLGWRNPVGPGSSFRLAQARATTRLL